MGNDTCNCSNRMLSLHLIVCILAKKECSDQKHIYFSCVVCNISSRIESLCVYVYMCKVHI